MYFVYRNLVVDFDFDFVVQDMYFVYRNLVIDFDFVVQDMYLVVDFDFDVRDMYLVIDFDFVCLLYTSDAADE